MVLASVPDERLVARVRGGDDRAFEELYRRYHGRVAGFVRRMVKDHGRSEDLAQETFLSALRRLRATDSRIAFRPWIFEIAKNACIDLYRRSSRTEELPLDGDPDLLRRAEDARLVGGVVAPETAVLDKERLSRLWGAMNELSESHHRIIVMRELEGRSYREIGERLALSPPAVESTLFRARRRLEREYVDSEATDGRSRAGDAVRS